MKTIVIAACVASLAIASPALAGNSQPGVAAGHPGNPGAGFGTRPIAPVTVPAPRPIAPQPEAQLEFKRHWRNWPAMTPTVYGQIYGLCSLPTLDTSGNLARWYGNASLRCALPSTFVSVPDWYAFPQAMGFPLTVQF